MPSPQTTEFLTRYGLSVEQARDIIAAHLHEPAAIYAAAQEEGLNFSDLAELVGVNVAQVQDYFVAANLTPAITLLAQHGYTLSDLRPVVNQWVEASPTDLYEAAVQYGLRLDILAEISGQYSPSELDGIFQARDLNTAVLGGTGGGAGGGGTPLFSGDLPSFFQQLVGFNDQDGVPANDVIRAKVLAQGVSQAAYEAAFSASHYAGAGDGNFDVSDLGFSHLGAFAATQANLESLYFGTIIRTFNAIDEQELNEIIQFGELHEEPMAAGDPATLQAYLQLLQSVFEDPAQPPMFPAEVLADTVAMATAFWIQNVGTQGGSLFSGDTFNIFGG